MRRTGFLDLAKFKQILDCKILDFKAEIEFFVYMQTYFWQYQVSLGT